MGSPTEPPTGPLSEPSNEPASRRSASAAISAWSDGLRLGFSTLTAFPVGPPASVDRGTAGRAMVLAPAVGLTVGGLAGGVAALAAQWTRSPLAAGVAAVATLAAATRALHLDGLADTADGLGSARPAADALRIMKASDIGPFGVVALVLALLAQVALVADAWGLHGAWYGAALLATAAMAGRLAVTWACRGGVPSARPDGLGAWVAGSVGRGTLIGASLAGLGVATGLGALAGAAGTLYLWPLAVALGVAASGILLRHAVRRFGGITGDVLGALVETAFTAALVVLAR